MKNLPTLMENGGGKTKDQGSDSLVVTLNTLYPCKGSLNNLITVATKRSGEPQLLGGLGRPCRLGVFSK